MGNDVSFSICVCLMVMRWFSGVVDDVLVLQCCRNFLLEPEFSGLGGPIPSHPTLNPFSVRFIFTRHTSKLGSAASFKLNFLSRQMGYVLNVVSFKNELSIVKKKLLKYAEYSFWLAFFGVKMEGVNF